MAFIPGSDGHRLSDAISIAGDRVFSVVQVADPAGNLVDPSAGGGGGGGSFPSSIEISNDSGNAIPVSGPLTDTQLRATPITITGAVTGPLTDTQLRASAVAVSGPLTDTQLRATAVPVSGPLTDTQLRATAVPVIASVATRTPTTSSVTSSASSGVIINSNSNRKGLSISNISTAKLYLSFSNPATIANSFIEVPSGAFLLFDQQLIVTNAIYGIWASANGTAQVTEYV